MPKVDLYNYENRWKNWKEEYSSRDLEDVTKINSDFIKQYLFDMEEGKNVSTKNKKGGRSYARLNVLRDRLLFLSRLFEEKKCKDLVKLNADDVHEIFEAMRKGEITKRNGQPFKSSADYVKCFKAFWHWHQKVNRRKKKPVYLSDITEDLDSSYDHKPTWVYLSEKQTDKLISKANNHYKPLFLFFHDTGCRVTEGFSTLVEDITTDSNGIIYVNLREENSKTFGRKIKLMQSGKQILQYIKEKELKPEDRIFSHSLTMTNKYLGELAKSLFGENNSEAGEKYSNMTMYDWRHIASCFWIDRYKRDGDIKYKFGWKTDKQIHYYNEFRGKKDKISDDDMYVDVTKTELEKDISKLKKQIKDMQPIYDQVKKEREWVRDEAMKIVNEAMSKKN